MIFCCSLVSPVGKKRYQRASCSTSAIVGKSGRSPIPSSSPHLVSIQLIHAPRATADRPVTDNPARLVGSWLCPAREMLKTPRQKPHPCAIFIALRHCNRWRCYNVGYAFGELKKQQM